MVFSCIWRLEELEASQSSRGGQLTRINYNNGLCKKLKSCFEYFAVFLSVLTFNSWYEILNAWGKDPHYHINN